MTFNTKVKSQVKYILAEVDVSDESGNVKNLRDFPQKYASELLNDRERLVLLRVDSELI